MHRPWFSGLCLDGEVARLYEMESSGSQQELEGKEEQGVLELDGLSPITIFVGANAGIQPGHSQAQPDSDNTTESTALAWPIKDVGRSRLLTTFLRESSMSNGTLARFS